MAVGGWRSATEGSECQGAWPICFGRFGARCPGGCNGRRTTANGRQWAARLETTDAGGHPSSLTKKCRGWRRRHAAGVQGLWWAQRPRCDCHIPNVMVLSSRPQLRALVALTRTLDVRCVGASWPRCFAAIVHPARAVVVDEGDDALAGRGCRWAWPGELAKFPRVEVPPRPIRNARRRHSEHRCCTSSHKHGDANVWRRCRRFDRSFPAYVAVAVKYVCRALFLLFWLRPR